MYTKAAERFLLSVQRLVFRPFRAMCVTNRHFSRQMLPVRLEQNYVTLRTLLEQRQQIKNKKSIINLTGQGKILQPFPSHDVQYSIHKYTISRSMLTRGTAAYDLPAPASTRRTSPSALTPARSRRLVYDCISQRDTGLEALHCHYFDAVFTYCFFHRLPTPRLLP